MRYLQNDKAEQRANSDTPYSTNKRIGTHAMLVFLALNGIELSYSQKELYEEILYVAAGEHEYEELLRWVLAHQK